MPTATLTWHTYEARVPSGSRLRAMAALSAAGLVSPMLATAETVQISLPNLKPWPAPLDKVEILLETAAEIEHALMVQYLYAAYSLKSSDEVTDAQQQAALDEWPNVFLSIAREEMGHLMTVQNLLLLLGLPPSYEREDFPPRKDLYPFTLHLEPLTQKSLAKYVVAEAPADAADIDAIRRLAQEATGSTVNHVGILYALLGLVFATPEEVQSGGSGSDAWDEVVRDLASVAYQQDPPDNWHLPDRVFHPASVAQQGDPADWQVGDVRVHRVADRLAARQAIRDVGEQGEGPTNEGSESHFERFRRMFTGETGLLPFPAAGEWLPTRGVPTDPTLGTMISEARTRRWAEMSDLRYALLLGFAEHYLHASGDDRRLVVGWIFSEMRSRLAPIARRLTEMPRGAGGGVAAAPFTLPEPIHLPGAEPARWEVHQRRIVAALAKGKELQISDPSDQADPFISTMLTADRERLTFIAGRTVLPSATTSFARDIVPLFRPIDVSHMLDLLMDLGDYATVRAEADNILERVSIAGQRRMPPPPAPAWTQAQISLFAKWMDDGFPP